MKSFYFLLSLIFAGYVSNAQLDSMVRTVENDRNNKPLELNAEILEIYDVTKRAMFGVIENDLSKFLAQNIIYPVFAKENQVTGRIILDLTVETDGTISSIKSVGRKLGYGLEEEAIRVLKLTSGKWTSAEKEEAKVRMRFRLPVSFKI